MSVICPLGFGRAGGGGGPLTQYHCPRCRSLLHAPVRTQCGHVFCRDCIATCRDCLACGADAAPLTPDETLAATIAALLKGHGQAAGGGSIDFLVQLACESLHGGNAQAAYDRLDFALDLLSTGTCTGSSTGTSQSHGVQEHGGEQAAGGTSGGSGSRVHQRGTLLALQADCLRRLGTDAPPGAPTDTWARAEALYAQAVHVLREEHAAAPGNVEVSHTLSTTHLKLGDLHYHHGRLQSARACYEQAALLRMAAALHAAAAGAAGAAGDATSTASGAAPSADDVAVGLAEMTVHTPAPTPASDSASALRLPLPDLLKQPVLLEQQRGASFASAGTGADGGSGINSRGGSSRGEENDAAILNDAAVLRACEADVRARLDLATSMVKVADVCCALSTACTDSQGGASAPASASEGPSPHASTSSSVLNPAGLLHGATVHAVLREVAGLLAAVQPVLDREPGPAGPATSDVVGRSIEARAGDARGKDAEGRGSVSDATGAESHLALPPAVLQTLRGRWSQVAGALAALEEEMGLAG